MVITSIATIGINIILSCISNSFNLLVILDNCLFSITLCYIFPSLFLIMLNILILKKGWSFEDLFNLLLIFCTSMWSVFSIYAYLKNPKNN